MSGIYPEEEGADSPKMKRISIILNGGKKEIGRDDDEDNYTAADSDSEDGGPLNKTGSGPHEGLHNDRYVSV